MNQIDPGTTIGMTELPRSVVAGLRLLGRSDIRGVTVMNTCHQTGPVVGHTGRSPSARRLECR